MNEEVVAEEAEEYSEWIWEDFETVLTKSSIGFGFTLQPIGPSYDINTQLQEGQSEEEGLYLQQLKRLGDALQITEIVEDGPAHNAYLQPGTENEHWRKISIAVLYQILKTASWMQNLDMKNVTDSSTNL